MVFPIFKLELWFVINLPGRKDRHESENRRVLDITYGPLKVQNIIQHEYSTLSLFFQQPDCKYEY